MKGYQIKYIVVTDSVKCIVIYFTLPFVD